MEAISEFKTALKKTVIMFNTMTGKDLTEEEGSIFINLLDMTEGYQPLITTGTSGMVVSVGQAGNISVAPVTACQVYPAEHDQTAERPDPRPLKGLPEEFSQATAAAEVDDYVVPPITTSSRNHIQGYDWQIAVLSRAKDASDSYVVHFAYKPTQKQFEEHFVKFIAQTHYVHVNEWNSAWVDWMVITNLYEIEHLSKPKQDHDPRWEQADMAYRVRHFDRETGELSFLYLKTKPTGAELAKYHHTKGFAVVQSKVA